MSKVPSRPSSRSLRWSAGALWACALLGLLLPVACSPFSVSGKKLVIVGVDGMDPVLTREFMDQGLMPNLQKLAAEGVFVNLGTSNPPQSPVAWSNFMTGTDPGGHGVFDFLHRNPEDYTPRSFADTAGKVGEWNLPGKYKLPSPFAGAADAPQRTPPFWKRLEDEGVRAAVYRIPAHFPVDEDTDQVVLADMGVPDLLGGMGTYYYFYEEVPDFLLRIKTGKRQQVSVEEDGKVRMSVEGPPSPVIEDDPDTRMDESLVFTPLTAYLDPNQESAYFEVGEDGIDGRCTLAEGEWSDWLPITFDLGALQTAGGICRLYLKQVRPSFELYVTPIQIDPEAPASVISAPADAVEDLAAEIGRFYTQGLAENTKALQEYVLTDGEFLDQCGQVNDERLKMLDYALDRFDDGALFFYFSTIDLRCHMMWRHIEPAHPAREEELAQQHEFAIRDAYVKVDQAIGHLRERLDADTRLIVLSDHGFSPLLREMHVNRWLKDQGYLALTAAGEAEYAKDGGTMITTAGSMIDWSRTRAYAMGFNGIYVNVEGREAQGCVAEADREALAAEIRDQLLQVMDPKTGQRAVRRAWTREDAYQELPQRENAPDVLIGFERGYGASDSTALGELPHEPEGLFLDNTSRWSGNHLMDPEVVPGVLFTDLPVTKADPDLCDVTATLMKYFDLEVPAEFAGVPLY